MNEMLVVFVYSSVENKFWSGGKQAHKSARAHTYTEREREGWDKKVSEREEEASMTGCFRLFSESAAVVVDTRVGKKCRKQRLL